MFPRIEERDRFNGSLVHYVRDVPLGFWTFSRKGEVVNLILLTIIFGCAIALCLGIIVVLMCLCKSYREEIEQLENPMIPPVKSWVDTYYESK